MTTKTDVLQLVAGSLSVGLVPAIGGSVSHFRCSGIDLMRPLSAADREAGDVLGVAMFPMMPYANRIAGNAFVFGGETLRFDPNNGAEKYNVHGTAWKRPWTIASGSQTDALLTLSVDEPAAPFSYRATQRFSVDAGGMTVAMTIANAGLVAMPFGFGLHPWFERDADVILQFAAGRFYLEEPQGVAGDPISVPPELDFAAGRPLPRGWRNNDYGAWKGLATVAYPSRGLKLVMKADPVFRHLMLYADPSRSFFCVEPQTNASGAFNRPDGFSDPEQGAIVLSPGESAAGSVRFDVVNL